MGGAKDAMIRHEEDIYRATAYLVKQDVLDRCEAHGEVYGGGFWKLEPDFWRSVMADRNRGAGGPIPWAAEMEARAFTDLLKEAYERASGEECSRCAKLMAE